MVFENVKKIANVMSTEETCILMQTVCAAFMNPLLYLGQRHVI